MRKLIYDSYKKVSELVLPPHTTSSFKRDGVRRGSTVAFLFFLLLFLYSISVNVKKNRHHTRA